ncbi:MAG: amidohydrolase [Clostridia bacterium]|nr:amidohydrolase [Clostridia bacterium]
MILSLVLIEKSNEMVYNLIMGNSDYLVKTRRELHRIPEPSEREYKTSDYIAAELKRMGHKFRRMGTGIVCDVKGERTDKTTALRCDIDALPITEKTDCPYKSENGYMHACGHDGHTAMLLCVANELAARRPRNNVRLIFQFGEEGDGGADKMIGMGAIDGVDEIYAFHMCPELEKGKIASTDGAMFAGTVEFDVAFTGKSCHCADVSQGNDALKSAVQFYFAAQECNADCKNNTVFHIGKLEGGSSRNVVAGDATAYCTFRYFDSADIDKIMMRLENVLTACDIEWGTEHRVTVHAVYPPLVNNPAALANVRALTNVETCAPRFTAEDFAFYLQKICGCMLWLGCKDQTYSSPLHSDTFGFDESALALGVELYEKLIF